MIIQIEHIAALDHLDDTLAVPGIDGVLIGPYDLSGSMGMLGDVAAEPVQQAIATAARTAIDVVRDHAP